MLGASAGEEVAPGDSDGGAPATPEWVREKGIVTCIEDPGAPSLLVVSELSCLAVAVRTTTDGLVVAMPHAVGRGRADNLFQGHSQVPIADEGCWTA